MNLEEYERSGQAIYIALATTISAILSAAIEGAGGYRLQQIKERAKDPQSLYRKLQQRGLVETTSLESEIKDLAGCRVIFYTNSDINRFTNSDIIDSNFEILDIKLHHPKREVEDAAELYTSNHYLVRLHSGRTALPEYSKFAGLRCEIQLQTILNHAWAEMAHDTIYKMPALDDFGRNSFDGIKRRMQKVARKYLVPAGYEFQQIANDFERLIQGKALFDSDALEAVVEAQNNNLRAEALERFSENVLPLYDDPQEVYAEVVERLLAATTRARASLPVPIETPYGALPAKTYADIARGVADILKRYRYFDVAATFQALCTLYGHAQSEDEKKPLRELGVALSKHNLQAWQQHGPAVQVILVDLIEALGDEERRGFEPFLIEMLGECLGTEVSGTTNSSATVTFHRGAVVASKELRLLREKAIAQLKRQFELTESEHGRRAILLALQAATRPPFSADYTNALALLVMNDTCAILEFETEIAPTLTLQMRQSTEDRVHRCYTTYAELREKMREDQLLVAAQKRIRVAAIAFRELINADRDFEIYKTLVGFDSVFAPAWEDKTFGYEQAEAYRANQVDQLLASVKLVDADVWFERINRYAQTQSDDAATFPVFGRFLERLAELQPVMVVGYLDKLEGALANFLPGMLAGLMRSAERPRTTVRIGEWLDRGEQVANIAWYLRFADPFDQDMLSRVLACAIEHEDAHAVRNVLIATVTQYAAHPGKIIEHIFLPALNYLRDVKDFSWVRMPWFSWLNSPIMRALDEDQAKVVLETLVLYPDLEDGAEQIVAAIALRWPAAVVGFIGERQTFGRTEVKPPRYDAVPFDAHELQKPLAAVPDILLLGARGWFEEDALHFPYNGARIIFSVFPDLSNGLDTRLAALINGGNQQDIAFVFGVLAAYEGKPCIYDLVRTAVAALDPGSELLEEARTVLDQSGVVVGAFGFAELQTGRKALMEEWLDDANERVKAFAAERIHDLDQRIAGENRRAEASVAMRQLAHDEDLDVGAAD